MAPNLIRDVSIERETMSKTREGPNAIRAGGRGLMQRAAGKKSPGRKSQLEKRGKKRGDRQSEAEDGRGGVLFL